MRIGHLRIKPTKYLLIAYFLYDVLISRKWFYVPGLSMLLIVLTIGCALLEYNNILTYAISSNGLVGSVYLFWVASVICSYLTAIDFSTAWDTLFRLFQYLGILIVCVLICVDEGKIDRIVHLLIFIAIIMGAIIFLKPIRYFASSEYTIYLTIAESTSPHTVGVYLLLGIWAALYCIPSYKTGFKSAVFLLGIIVFLTSAIFLTNSRKSLVGVPILLLFSLKPLADFLKKSLNSNKRILLILFAILLIVAGGVWVSMTDLLTQNNMVVRLGAGASDESNGVRIDEIEEAFTVFLHHPIIGVGFDNYRFYSSRHIYSHNTYVELLACCGLLAGAPFIIYLWKLTRMLMSRKYKNVEDGFFIYHRTMMLVLFVLILYLGMMQIMFYERTLMFALSIITSFVLLTDYNLKEKSVIS